MELSPKLTIYSNTKEVSTYRRIFEIAPYIISEHQRLKQDIIRNNRNSRKRTNTGKLNNSLLYEIMNQDRKIEKLKTL